MYPCVYIIKNQAYRKKGNRLLMKIRTRAYTTRKYSISVSHNRMEGIDVAGGRYRRAPYALVSSYCTPDEFEGGGGGGGGWRGSRGRVGQRGAGRWSRRRLGPRVFFFIIIFFNGVQIWRRILCLLIIVSSFLSPFFPYPSRPSAHPPPPPPPATARSGPLPP